MMEKKDDRARLWEHVRGVVEKGVLILMALQILSGLLWAAGNLWSLQGFAETRELLEISDTLVTDEYVGILYPCLIRCARLLALAVPVPYYVFLYLLQWGAGFAVLLRILGPIPRRAFCALWVMTIPVVNQFYLAVLPQSLAASLLLLCLYECRKGERVRGAVWGSLAGLLVPEYFLFAFGIYIVEWVCSVLRGRKGSGWQNAFWKGLAPLLAACLLCGAVTVTAVEPYSRGRMARTPAAMALHRMVWPNFSSNQYFWYGLITDVFQQDALEEISRDPEKVARVFGYGMEEVYGKKEAQRIYWDMAGVTFRMRTREIVGNMINDFTLYALQPFVLSGNLEGEGVSYSGWNYGRMAENTPGLTRWYVSFAGNLLLPVGLLCLFWRLAGGRRKGTKGTEAGKLFPLLRRGAVLSFALAVWYTMSASGMQDYKNAIPISICWGILILLLFVRDGGKGLEEEV